MRDTERRPCLGVEQVLSVFKFRPPLTPCAAHCFVMFSSLSVCLFYFVCLSICPLYPNFVGKQRKTTSLISSDSQDGWRREFQTSNLK